MSQKQGSEEKRRLGEAHKQVDIVAQQLDTDHAEAARLTHVREELEQIRENL